MSRFIAVLVLAVTALFGASLPASAHGPHVSVGIYAGAPVYPAYYPHHYYRHYWGPRVVYTAPVIYAPPPPVYYRPAPVPAPAPAAVPTRQCRTYNGNATIDGSGDPFFGTACVFTDGRWHIMN
jgi:hypothetical protein